MLRKLVAVAGTAFFLVFISITALAADSPPIVEAYGCNFVDGKGMADLDAVAEYYASNRSKIDSPELQKLRSVVWTPFRGSVDVDLVWFNSNVTLNEWGSLTDAYESSSVGRDIQAKFDAVALCETSGLYTNEVLLRTDKQFEQDDGVMIESFRCEYRPGQGVVDSDAAIAAWKPVFEKAVSATNSAAFVARRQPIISGSGFDLGYLVVWDDATAYAEGNSAYRADPDSAEADGLFAAAHRCRSALFNGRIIVPAPE
ncbi:MAG: hypothetical protein O7F71_05045 [Gammaproteobacteria bacterium]|nr:hypothetical protein [Gammaproteobacteria bacterium]